jgi:dolichol-phosphate mannosyltransferase
VPSEAGHERVLVIVPTYNERENVERLIDCVLAQDERIEMLIVDDGSPDGTGAVVDGIVAANPRVHVLHRERKMGLGTAYIAGFKWALEKNYEFIFEMDCDFSHDPDEIAAFLKAAENADLVLGSRYSGGIRVINWPLRRLMLSRCAGKYVALVTGMPFTDPTGGYKCFRRRALQSFNFDDIRSIGYGFQIELTHKLWRQGFKIVEVPIIFTDRAEGTSKMSGHIVGEAFWMVWKLWLQNGLRRSPRKNLNT